jgi:2-haloacid dehalogenase
MEELAGVRALLFDVFGTVVDWRGAIIAEGEELGRKQSLSVDWAAFADAWRGGYQPAMARVRRGELPWTSIDVLHRMILDELLPRFGIDTLSESEIDHLNRVWHRLLPWPDAVAGLARLRSRLVVATLSNGNVALLVNMAKHAGLPWDCILSAELFHCYKPDAQVYRGAVELLGLTPPQVMMVAAHPEDLAAAKAVGLRTAYVDRPLEYGPTQVHHRVDEGDVDILAGDFHQLADRLT